jgi:hyperosmotically inducible protein
MKIKRVVTALVLLLTLVVSTLAANKPIDDNYIYDSVREKLASDSVVKGGAIDVDVKDGVVTLKGKVTEAKQKSKAENLAKKVKGVKSVINQLQVTPL